MIDLIESVLDQRGLVPAARFDSCNIFNGKNLVFHAYDNAGDFVVVKVKASVGAEDEYNAQQLAYDAMPELVPRPLALDRVADRYLLVFQGVAHRPVQTDTAGRDASAIADSMCLFIDRTRSAFALTDEREPHSVRVARLIESQSGAVSSILRRFADRLPREDLDSLPHVSQHGDFVVNNIGICDGGVVIFDWEDLGRVTLPGFDIALMICSCLGHDVARIERLLKTGRPQYLDSVISHFCAGEFDRDLFGRLLPVYYGIFLDLKRSMGYGTKIIETCQRNLSSFAA